MPIMLPTLESTVTSRILVTLFFQKPRKVTMSEERFSRSLTWGFRIYASVNPETQPAAIMGFREVRGAAAMAERMVKG